MKTLLAIIALLSLGAACTKEPRTEFQEKQQEANQDYREEVNEAAEDRNEEIRDASEDLREEQKEEAEDYVDESDSAVIDRDMNRVNVQESEENREEARE